MFTSTSRPEADRVGNKPPMGRRLAELASDLGPRRRSSRLLMYVAAFWMVSAAFHSIVFLTDNTAWSGSVSWRKPISFSLSIGLLIWAFGWVLDRLPNRPRLAMPLAGGFAATSSVEVGLIAVQQWRGRPSHFNTFSGEDTAVFIAMGIMVALMSVFLLTLSIWALVERPDDRVERIAVLAGLAMVAFGLGIGQWLLSLGNSYVDQFDRVPESLVNGEAGVAKFPHAVSFHGIQVFMVAAALLGRSTIKAATAARTVKLTVVTYAGVLFFSALQTFDGRAPLDLNVLSGPLLVTSVVGLFGLLALMARWWWTSTAEDAGESNGAAWQEPVGPANLERV